MLIKYIKNVYRYVKIGNEGEEKRERVSYYQFTDDAVEYFMPDIYNELKNTKVDNSSKTKRMEEVVEDAIETMGIDFSDETAEMESTKKNMKNIRKGKKPYLKVLLKQKERRLVNLLTTPTKVILNNWSRVLV